VHTHETQSRGESCVFSFNHLILITSHVFFLIRKKGKLDVIEIKLAEKAINMRQANFIDEIFE